MSEEHQKKSFSVPAHIAIIMDGNGRWAKRRGLPRNAGHKQGAKAFENICDYCQKIGVKYVTVYAFSTENWKRPQSEVDAIMELLRSYLKEASKQVKRNVRLLFLGDRAPLAFDLQQLMESAERESEKNTGITVCVALNYGGRAEIVHSARELAQMAARGELDPDSIDERLFERHLYTAGIPDPRPADPPQRPSFVSLIPVMAAGLYRICLPGCAMAWTLPQRIWIRPLPSMQNETDDLEAFEKQRIATAVIGLTIFFAILALYQTIFLNISAAVIIFLALHEMFHVTGVWENKALSAVCLLFGCALPFFNHRAGPTVAGIWRSRFCAGYFWNSTFLS